jgi:DNA-binding GntR family transcriptional regulator
MQHTLSGNSSETIFEILKNKIINMDLKPGQSLSEHELCERFSVSRTPIRAVLRRLNDLGLVIVLPYKGTYVAKLNLDHIHQMIYLRVAAESMVIRDFIDIATPIILEKVRYVIRKQKVAITQEGFKHDDFFKLDTQLHRIWFRETEKLNLWDYIDALQIHYTRYRMLDYVRTRNYEQIISEHESLFDAICRKNKDIIESLLKEHLYGGINRLSDDIYSEFGDYFETEDEDKMVPD